MSLTPHNALIISDKPGIESRMSIYLQQAGISHFSMAQSLREGVQKAMQELPHVIVVLEDMADATGIRIIEELRKQPCLDRALIFLVKECTQEELVRTVQLRVASVIPRPNDANLLIDKLKQKLALLGGLSPYALRGEYLQGGNHASLRIPLKIVGKSHDHVVCKSPLSARSGTTATIQPQDESLAPFVVTFAASNAEAGPDGNFHNYFSLDGIMGQGRAWLQTRLAELRTPRSGRKRRLLMFERSRERVDPIRKMLSFHGIEVEHADSVSALCSLVRTRPEEFGAIYFSENLMGSVAVPWDRTKREIGPEKLPLEIASSEVQRPSSSPNVIWLQKPFGIDQVVQGFHAALAASGGANAKSAMKPIDCVCVAASRIVAIDESGGILLSRVQPAANCEFRFDHPLLSGHSALASGVVVDAEPHAADPNWTVVRFLFSKAASSKEKYWNAVYRLFDAQRVSANLLGGHKGAAGHPAGALSDLNIPAAPPPGQSQQGEGSPQKGQSDGVALEKAPPPSAPVPATPKPLPREGTQGLAQGSPRIPQAPVIKPAEFCELPGSGEIMPKFNPNAKPKK